MSGRVKKKGANTQNLVFIGIITRKSGWIYKVNQLTKRCALEHEKHQSTVSHCIKWLEVVEEQYSLGLIGRGEYLNKVISTADTLRNQSVQMKERS